MDNNNMDRYLGQLLDGRYEILEVIGRGGMAVVYKARCHLLNRNVAIKILRDDMAADSDFRLHFKKEAQAVAMLSHANIVSVYDVSRTPDVDYIVMELLEGITLKQYMKTKGILSCKESVHFSTQIARALSHAHGKGIIHRDIKPQNIMIGLDGGVKVADFGIAHLESALGENKNTAVGSVHYTSPEQARGLPADARSDIYSLGVVMYEMLTGKLPFSGETAEDVALQHVSAAPTAPRELNPEIPEELEHIVLKAMNADIDQRYQSADALLSDLEDYRLSRTGTLPAVSEEPEKAEPAPAAPVASAAAAASVGAESVPLPENVPPIGRSGELSKENYARRHRRANKISLLSGILLVIIFAVAVFVFLWNYWLKDIFAEPVKINVPNFIGYDVDDITNNEELKKIYNFEIMTVADPEKDAGIIIRQEPEPGKSRTLDNHGIDVQLTVSAGIQMIQIPDVVNKKFTEAVSILQKSGFLVDSRYEVSDSVTAEYVISTSPEAGDKIPAGGTVYMTVSSGPNIVTVQMPNLIGLSRAEAVAKLEANKLTVGTITPITSELPEGTVIWQSVDAYKTVNEHDIVYLQISSGPPETEPPVETEPPEETPSVIDPIAPLVDPNTPDGGQ